MDVDFKFLDGWLLLEVPIHELDDIAIVSRGKLNFFADFSSWCLYVDCYPLELTVVSDLPCDQSSNPLTSGAENRIVNRNPVCWVMQINLFESLTNINS